MTRIIFGVLLIVIGLSALTGLSLIKFVIALILIFLGIRLIVRKGDHFAESGGSVSNEDYINDVVIFGPLNKVIKSDNFKGGKVVAVFGGGELDLRLAKAADKNVNLEFVAVFGGGKLIIPKDWRVNSQGTAIFGGFSNKAITGEGDTTLTVKGAAIFGGVEIVN